MILSNTVVSWVSNPYPTNAHPTNAHPTNAHPTVEGIQNMEMLQIQSLQRSATYIVQVGNHKEDRLSPSSKSKAFPLAQDCMGWSVSPVGLGGRGIS